MDSTHAPAPPTEPGEDSGDGASDVSSDDASEDSFDRVLRRVVTTGATGSLSTGSVLAGRFRIERLLGSGGMGTVYVAHDQTLRREVAIKLHHVAGGNERLRREAIAMARLSHPNVVAVYEVGELDQHPFVVMEYVRGQTLRSWLAARPRSPGEILGVACAAGAGLAAAHDAGLLHRDFKPENVLIGDDGRARVGDFGLARESSEHEAANVPGGDELGVMTRTGDLVGTPAYMAPEQFSSPEIDARADEFSFCVTVWEALWKQRPYTGDTIDDLLKSYAAGARLSPPASPRIPARVRAALVRGLSPDPAERFATMHELLHELRPRTKRRYVAGAAVLAAAIGGGVWIGQSPRAAEVSCDDAGAALSAIVPHELPGKLRAIGATDAAARVAASLDELDAALVAGARLACDAGRRRGEWSPELLAKSDVCLRVAAKTARELLAVDTVTTAAVPELVLRSRTGLPEVSGCSSPTYLAGTPLAAEDLDETVAIYTEIAMARAELDARHRDRARVHLQRIERSPLRGLPEIRAWTLLLQGLEEAVYGDDARGEKLLVDAYYAGRSLDSDPILGSALVSLLGALSDKVASDPLVTTWIRTSLSDAERLARRSPSLAAGLYLVAAEIEDSNGDSDAALDHVMKGRALVRAGDTLFARSLRVEGMVLIWKGKVDEGTAMFERALAMQSERLGADHPLVGIWLADLAALLLETSRTQEALEASRRALAIVQVAVTPDDAGLDHARANLAAVLAELGDAAEAQKLLETARANYVTREGERSASVANIDMNLGLILNDAEQTQAAITKFRSALSTMEEQLGPTRVEVAQILFNLAVALQKVPDLEGALAAARRCAAIHAAQRPGLERHRIALGMVAQIANKLGRFQEALEVTATALAFTSPVESRQTIAWPQLERARALIATGKAREAEPLLEAARKAYLEENMPARVDEIDRLRAKSR